MILPQCQIISRQHEHSLFTGVDTLDLCKDKQWFNQYPYSITYDFNSRGFRDAEWPDNLSDAVWCIGDSATLGVGQCFEHTWPQRLQQQLKKRTINASMEGASNAWIARHAKSIIEEFDPIIVVQWTFSSRRELPLEKVLEPLWKEYYANVKAPSWPAAEYIDELSEDIKTKLAQDPRANCYWEGFDLETPRKLSHLPYATYADDLIETQRCIDLLKGARVVHSFYPGWHPRPVKLDFNSQLSIPSFSHVDYARDGQHYDINTVDYFVPLLAQQVAKYLHVDFTLLT